MPLLPRPVRAVKGDSPIFADQRFASVPAKIGTVPSHAARGMLSTVYAARRLALPDQRDPLSHFAGLQWAGNRDEAAFAQTAKPRALPLGQLPRVTLQPFDRIGQVSLARQVLDHLAVADGLARGPTERLRTFQETPDLVHQARGEHFFHAALDANVKLRLGPIEHEHAAIGRGPAHLELPLKLG